MPNRRFKRPRTTVGSRKRGRRTGSFRHRRVGRRRVHPARRTARRLKNNLEVKTQTHQVREDNLGFHAGSATYGPANSLCLLAGLFGGNDLTPANVNTGLVPGTGCYDIIGCWSTPAYPTSMKLDIDYKNLIEVAGETFPNPNLRIIHGFYKNTGDKMSADLTSNATWINSIRVALLKELFDSSYAADYLVYTQKSRNVRILSDKLIRPRKAVAVQVTGTTTTGIRAPNTQLSLKWPHSKLKTRLVPSTQAGSNPVTERMMPHNSWIPFMLALAPGIPEGPAMPGDYGHLTVRSVTKAYFNDA